MRILHIAESAATGVGRHVVDLIEGQVAAGHTVDLVHGTKRVDAQFSERIGHSGARTVIGLAMSTAPSPGDLRVVRKLRRIIATHGPYDVVHGHASKGGALARLVARSGRGKSDDARHVVVYTPNAFKSQTPGLRRPARLVLTTIERALARRTDGLICVSPQELEHANAYGYTPPHPRQHVVIPNGIALTALPSRAEARAELGLGRADHRADHRDNDRDDPVVVGWVGRFDRQKRPKLLIRAVAQLRDVGVDVTLAMVGPTDNAHAAKALAAELNIDHAIRWLGRRDGQRAMAAFDVFALPSRYEGFPYVVLEALHAGVPVVATQACNAEAALIPHGAGLITEPNLTAFTAALRQLCTNPELRADMSAQAHRAVSEFTAAKMVARTIEFYLRTITAAATSTR